MIQYLKRYQENAAQNYENSRVWAELTSLGADIRQEPLYSDARAVARETMTRARHNVSNLVERLKTIGYRYIEPDEIWVPPDQSSIAQLDDFEQRFGWLPLSLRMWYEIVGSVNFMGSHPILCRYYSFDLPSLPSLPIYADPLVIDPLARYPQSYYVNLVYDETGEEIDEPPYTIWLAPDAVHKADQSGGGPTQIMFPNPAIDAPLISDDWDGTLFVSYLRTCFQWGGFPGWRYQADYPKAELDYLRKDLLAL